VAWPAVETAPGEPAAGRPPAWTEDLNPVHADGRPAERPSSATSVVGQQAAPNPQSLIAALQAHMIELGKHDD
jgi:hypothetical protein